MFIDMKKYNERSRKKNEIRSKVKVNRENELIGFFN